MASAGPRMYVGQHSTVSHHQVMLSAIICVRLYWISWLGLAETLQSRDLEFCAGKQGMQPVQSIPLMSLCVNASCARQAQVWMSRATVAFCRGRICKCSTALLAVIWVAD